MVARPVPLTRPVPVVCAAVLALLTLLSCGPNSSDAANSPRPSTSASPSSSAPSPQPSPSTSPVRTTSDHPDHPQLPRGGTTLFPRYRLVGYSGGDSTPAFGRLGVGSLDRRVAEIERIGRAYTKGGRQPLPVLELITVVVQSHSGRDGQYRSRISGAQIDRYLAAARRHRALLLLNIQPGRADFLAEVKRLQRWLVEPDVGIALDPEWAVGAHQVPGRVFGRTSAKELNAVAAYLSAFTRAHGLPEKVMVVHQLAPKIVHRVQDVTAHPGVAVVLSVDGIGSRAAKTSTWRRLVKPLPDAVHPGFKLFFTEDRRSHHRLMTPSQVMALKPTPDYVLYE